MSASINNIARNLGKLTGISAIGASSFYLGKQVAKKEAENQIRDLKSRVNELMESYQGRGFIQFGKACVQHLPGPVLAQVDPLGDLPVYKFNPREAWFEGHNIGNIPYFTGKKVSECTEECFEAMKKDEALIATQGQFGKGAFVIGYRGNSDSLTYWSDIRDRKVVDFERTIRLSKQKR